MDASHPKPLVSKRVTGHVLLVKRKRGDQWYLKYRLADGRQVKRLLGPAWTGNGRPAAGHYTKRMAEEALHAVLTDARRGTLAGAVKTGATFADAAAEYLRYVEHVRQIDPATANDYRGVIAGYLIAEFGDQAVEAITPNMVDAYKEQLITERQLSNRVIVRHLTVLHGIFKRAKRVWGLAANPASADLVERPKLVYTGEFDTYTGDEVELLAAAADDAQEGAVYRVAAFTGLRQGELLALRWKDVDLVGGLLHVRRNYTDNREKVPKGKRVRSVPMTAAVVDTLARLKDREHFTRDEDLVFCNTVGGYLSPWSLRRHYYKAIDTPKPVNPDASPWVTERFASSTSSPGSHLIRTSTVTASLPPPSSAGGFTETSTASVCARAPGEPTSPRTRAPISSANCVRPRFP